MSPDTGSTAGGTSVAVTGTGFALGATGTAFQFGKVVTTEVSCSSTSTCTVLSPPAAKAVTVDVKAIVSAKRSKKNPPADQFTYN